MGRCNLLLVLCFNSSLENLYKKHQTWPTALRTLKKKKKKPQQEHTKIAKYYDVDIWMNI